MCVCVCVCVCMYVCVCTVRGSCIIGHTVMFLYGLTLYQFMKYLTMMRPSTIQEANHLKTLIKAIGNHEGLCIFTMVSVRVRYE